MRGSGTLPPQTKSARTRPQRPSTVVTSTSDCRARTITAPTIAPVAPAVIPPDNRGQPWAPAVAVEVGRRNHGEEERGQECRSRGDAGPGKPGDQVADETGGDHHRARGDEGDGDRIEKLPLREPMMLEHHAAVQKRHDREPAAENEASCIGKEPENLEQQDERFRPRLECPRRRKIAGGVRTSHTSAPPARMSETISRPVTAVAAATTRKIPQNNRSLPMVFLASP